MSVEAMERPEAAAPAGEAILQVRDLNAWYGKSHILQGVDLDVHEGEIVALLGRNGVGRSTTCKAIMGEVPPAGSVRFRGDELVGLPPFEIAKRGLGYVPENRDIFPGLSVRQNLDLGIKPGQRGGRWSVDDMFDMFENLRRRADVDASVLSGGEKQMLTMCRTLMGDPQVIMVDEPTEGLAPMIVEQIGDLLIEIAARGVSILLVEQKLTIALKVSSRVYVMGHGAIAYEGTPASLQADAEVRREWLEV